MSEARPRDVTAERTGGRGGPSAPEPRGGRFVAVRRGGLLALVAAVVGVGVAAAHVAATPHTRGAAAPVVPAADTALVVTGPTRVTAADDATVRRPLPYGVGERASYRVSWGVVRSVGTGTMHVTGIDTIRGRPAFRMLFTLQGRVLFVARVDNRFESWLDVDGVYSHRFEQNTHEVNFRRRRTREFFPDELRWTGHTNDRPESGELITAEPLDDTSFLYFIRTLDLEVGREYTFNRYWNPAGNPVTVRVLRHETVTVPAGTFDTVVLQPIIRTGGLFAEGGEAEVYFATDGPRQLVMLRARVSIGTLQLQLEEFEAAPAVP